MKKTRRCENVLCSGIFSYPEGSNEVYCSKRCKALDKNKTDKK